MSELHDVEARLRAALADRAAGVEPSSAGAVLSERRIAAARRAAARRRAVLSLAAAAVVLAVAIVGLGVADDDRETVRVTPSPTVVVPEGPALWPLASMGVTYGTPGEAAATFVEDYLGLPADGCDIDGSTSERSARLVVCDTTLELRHDGTLGWVVVDADAATFRIAAPADGEAVTGSFDVLIEPPDAEVAVDIRRLGELGSFDPRGGEAGPVVVVATDGRAGEVRVVEWSPGSVATSGTTVTATTRPPSPTSSSSSTTTTVPDDGTQGWPGTADARFAGDPDDAALAFAVEVLGFADPVVRSSETEGRSAAVLLVPRPTAGVTTTVRVHDTGARGWVVTGTSSSEGSIDSVTDTGDELVVEGVASAFEATVTVAVLGIDGTLLAETFTQGGSQGEQAPFHATVPDGGAAAWFVLVGEGDASGEGRLNWAAVVRVDQ